jgi:tripartite-type tricarboxylate transporter receptor subunit TctC
MRLRILYSLLLGLGIILSSSAIHANDYPSRAVTVVVGYKAGGGTDTYARILSSVIPEFINMQPLVIVNKPGGAQVISMKFTAKARPDGYTLQLFSAGTSVAATTLQDKGIDFLNDFIPIAQVGMTNQSIVANKETGFKTPQDLVAAIKKAKSNGKKLRWAHPGRGGITYLAGIAWLIKNGVQDAVQDVPFKGGSPTRAALLGNQVDFGVIGLQQTTGFSDKLNVLGIMSKERDQINKDAPTLEELDSPFVPIFSPMIVGAPKGTPAHVINTMSDAIRKATEHTAFKKLSAKAGLSVVYKNAPDTGTMMRHLQSEWQPTIDFVKKSTGR